MNLGELEAALRKEPHTETSDEDGPMRRFPWATLSGSLAKGDMVLRYCDVCKKEVAFEVDHWRELDQLWVGYSNHKPCGHRRQVLDVDFPPTGSGSGTAR